MGNFFAARDPWKHNLSIKFARTQPFPFTSGDDLAWVGRVEIQHMWGIKAPQIHPYDSVPRHVYMAEDYYEDYVPAPGFANPRYYYRWGFWSWILSGGSFNYGGWYQTIAPYSTTKFTGLDSVPHIGSYFKTRKIDLGLFQPDPGLVSDYRPGARVVNDAESMELMRRGTSEFIIYHPNYSVDGQGATLDSDIAAGFKLDLTSAPGTFSVEWYRPHDGTVHAAGTVSGGTVHTLTAPWVGYDAVLRLLKDGPAPREGDR